MTPLIDVMLVLLVIFMLTAPLMETSLPLELPKAEGTRPQPAEPGALRIGLAASGAVTLDGQPMDLSTLADRLVSLSSPDTEVHLQADRQVPYGRVAEVLGLLQKSGLHRIAFMADPLPPGGLPVSP